MKAVVDRIEDDYAVVLFDDLSFMNNLLLIIDIQSGFRDEKYKHITT